MKFKELLNKLTNNTLKSTEINLENIEDVKRTNEELVALCKAIYKNKEVRTITGLRVGEWNKPRVIKYVEFIERRININKLGDRNLFLESLQDNFNTFFMQPIVLGTRIGDYLKTPFQWLYDYVKDIGAVLTHIELPSFFPESNYSLDVEFTFYTVTLLAIPFILFDYIVTLIGRSLGLIIGGLIGLVLSPFSFGKSIFYDYPVEKDLNDTEIADATKMLDTFMREINNAVMYTVDDSGNPEILEQDINTGVEYGQESSDEDNSLRADIFDVGDIQYTYVDDNQCLGIDNSADDDVKPKNTTKKLVNPPVVDVVRVSKIYRMVPNSDKDNPVNEYAVDDSEPDKDNNKSNAGTETNNLSSSLDQ